MQLATLIDELATLNGDAEYILCSCDTDETVEIIEAIKELRPILSSMLALIKRHGGHLNDAG